VEVADPVGAVIGRRQPIRVLLPRPAGPVTRPDRQRPELVEGETPVQKLAGHLLDPVQLGVLVRIPRLLPGSGPLEGDPASTQDLPQPLPADPHPADRVVGQVVGELTDTPVGERAAQLGRARGGRRDDVLLVVTADQAGTASSPPRVQRGQPPLVERMDDIPDGVLMRRNQPGHRRHRRPRRRRHDDQRSAHPHRLVLAPPHDLLQLLPLLLGQPPRSDWLCHPSTSPSTAITTLRA
jgi:hypothetical protein